MYVYIQIKSTCTIISNFNLIRLAYVAISDNICKSYFPCS